MLALSDVQRLHSPRTALAARKRRDTLPIPPAKRVRTESSTSNQNLSSSKPVGHMETGHPRSDRWFDDVNNDAVATNDIPFVDNDPPFFFKRQDSEESSVRAHRSRASTASQQDKIGPTAPTASLLARMNATNDNASDDFRSVIDDLTVQNKKLRRKLGKYERLHCSHLQKEKLFEVKIHGLPAHKKRELEETLKKFASSIDGSLNNEQDHAMSRRSAMLKPVADTKPSSTSTSGSRPLDSAYASMSASGASQAIPRNKNMSWSTQNNVKSFLKDIPETLMPSAVFALSEKAKSKMVVRRLEQIFTGKGAKSRSQGHTQQQQEVSTAAAEADRSKLEAGGIRVWREGTREAHIVNESAGFEVDDSNTSTMHEAKGKAELTDSESRGHDASGSGTPEQRPTRPLDLDIHRAQVPSDNIDYIRHLGLASSTSDDKVMVDGEDEWVYLNLLTSMAQLHILNVTPEFIRKAVNSYSDKFELSKDGTKVRWFGGSEGTRLSSDCDDSEMRSNEKSPEASNPVSKRGSFADLSSKEELDTTVKIEQPQGGSKRRLVQLGTPDDSDRFHYKPLLTHPSPSNSAEDSSDLDSESIPDTASIEHATGMYSSSNAVQNRQRRFRGRNRENGPMIFYNGARFCTDLGGDPNPSNEDVSYMRYTQKPIGCEEALDTTEEPDFIASKDSPLSTSMEVDYSPSTWSRTALDLDDLKNSISDCASEHQTPVPMEVSGLGGIHPEDNFVVKVQTRRGSTQKLFSNVSPFSKSRRPIRKVMHSMPNTAVDAFKGQQDIPRSTATLIDNQVVSAVKTDMAPSTLPPPSYVHLPFTSSESDDDSSEVDDPDDMLPGQTNSGHHAQSMRYRDPQPGGHTVESSADTEAKESSYDKDDESDGSSIDFLAQARLQDPEAVRAREMEFEGNSRPQSVEGAGRRTAEDDDSDVDSMSVDQESSSDE